MLKKRNRKKYDFFFLLYSFYDIGGRFYYTVFGIDTSKGSIRVDRGIISDNSTGIQNAGAAYVGIIAENRPYLTKTRRVILFSVDNYRFSVGLKV